MKNENKDYILEEINNEIDRPANEVEVESVEKMIDLYLESAVPKISDNDAKKTADTIIAQYHIKGTTAPSHYSKRIAIIVVAALLFTSVVVASASHYRITDGIRWVCEKLNICTSEPTSDSSLLLQEAKQQSDILLADKNYKLPQSIPSNFIPKSYYNNQRSNECTDLCLEYVSDGAYINIIISQYSSRNTSGIEIPNEHTEVKEQINVNDVVITICSINEVYTAYYIHENCAYQITTNMSYDEFINLLNSIKK